MRLSAKNDFGDLKGVTAVTYGIAAALVFILIVGTIALVRKADIHHFEAGREDLVIPGSIA
jgi:hypothetical protein